MAEITREQLKDILANKPKKASDEAVVKQLIERGHTIEGLDLPSQREQRKRQEEAQARQQETVIANQERQARLAEVGQSAGQAITEAIQGEGEFAGQSPLRRGVSAVAEASSVPIRGAVALAPEPVRAGVEKVGDVVSKGFSKLTGLIGGIPALQKWVQENPEAARRVEEVAGTVAPAGEIAGNILGAEATTIGLGRAATQVRKAVPDANTIQDLFKSTLKNPENPTPADVTPETLRVTAKYGDNEQYTQAVDKMAEAYQGSLIGDKAAKTRLERIAREEDVTVEELMRNFVDARGLAGTVDDAGRVSFDNAIRDFTSRQTALAKAVDSAMANRTELTPVSTLRQQGLADIEARGSKLDRERVVKEFNRRVDGLEAQYPNGIPARELNLIRIEANQKYKEQFETDANKAIGNATRARIDELDPTLTQANAQWGRLEDMKDIAGILDGRRVDAGILADSMGSYFGASLVGASGLATGSGSLVIAGLAATFGRTALANAIRRRIINNPKNQELVNAVRQDEALVKEILDGIDEANRAQMERLLLPAQGQTTAPIQLPQAELGRGPGSKTINP